MRIPAPCRRLAVAVLLTAVGLVLPAAGAPLPKVRVAAGGRGFTNAHGADFVPFGVNYFRPGTGWAPQVWKRFDPEATRRDFRRLRDLGGNCVRVFLTYGSFYNDPGRLEDDGMAKLEQFLDLADEAGLYVHPTGPDHWEGLPEWARGDRISDEKVLQALEEFWRLLAARLRGRPTVFAYDLLNEPEVPWDSPSMRSRWNRWLESRHGSPESVAQAWGVESVPPFGEIPPPARDDAPADRRLLDYQRFREDVAETWTRRQARAIRAADPDALVTVGLIQWSVPVVLAHVAHYSAFRPDRQAPHLDFLSFHFYPLADGAYQYQGANAEAQNLAYLHCLAREHARFSKPVVLGEFGWHGGGKPRSFRDGVAATEDQQAAWCRKVVESTRPWVAGWLNWGFHDHPEARDVTEFTGLLTAEGADKAWARAFKTLAARLATSPAPAPPPMAPGPPSIDWDLQVTSRSAVDGFRAAYFQWHQRPDRP